MAPIPAQAKLTKSQFVGNLTNELISKKTPQEIIQIRTDMNAREMFISELYGYVTTAIQLLKADKTNPCAFKVNEDLTNQQIGIIMMRIYCIVKLSYIESSDYTKDDNAELAVYIDDPFDTAYGLYTTSTGYIKSLIQSYHRGLKDKDIDDIIAWLKNNVITVQRTISNDLVAVNNGIFDYKNKILLPFTPSMVFINKIPVNFNPKMSRPPIYTDHGENWDIESWFHSLSDDPAVINTLWQYIGATIRPNVAWGKALFLLNPGGNNGKGSYCQLINNLCGGQNIATVPLKQFGDQFGLSPIKNKNIIMCDENPVSSFLQDADKLKAVITKDKIPLNEKHKNITSYRFRGVIIQCINGIPKINDTTDSLYRRFISIPMDKCFTGKEKKWIKQDYLGRQDTLEYVLYKMLMLVPEYYDIDEPEVAKETLSEIKASNDTLRQFYNDVVVEFKWDRVPLQFAYDLYKKWREENAKASVELTKSTFTEKLMSICISSDAKMEVTDEATGTTKYYRWIIDKSTATTRITNAEMNTPEPLISRYGLNNWSAAALNATGKDIPIFAQSRYRMLTRTEVLE